ncbi:hypothetical protein GGX14DRAFT_395930 [Mycena pura]|uniref:Uncharacterized protein n=1 Tax=Mycena pura TaxID=153505 RepID=A0AAD6VBI5_9AGAR|nr:hypothetical protein GGX14DRAFT_395930 [Mycena pura]
MESVTQLIANIYPLERYPSSTCITNDKSATIHFIISQLCRHNTCNMIGVSSTPRRRRGICTACAAGGVRRADDKRRRPPVDKQHAGSDVRNAGLRRTAYVGFRHITLLSGEIRHHASGSLARNAP